MGDLDGLRVVADWARWMVATGQVSTNTASVYRVAVVRWMADTLPDSLATVSEDSVLMYLMSLSAPRRNDIGKALASFFRYLYDRSLLAGPNPMRDFRLRRDRVKPVKAYSREECHAIMDAAAAYPDLRAHPALTIMWTTGTRVGALAAAVRDDIDLSPGRETWTWTQAKAGVVYTTDLHPAHSLPAARALIDLHDAGYTLAKDGSRRDTLLGVGAESIRIWMHRVVRAAGLPDDGRGTPHTLRRSFATHLAQEGIDPLALMAVMGWRDTAQAARYVRPERSRLMAYTGRVG